MNVVKAVRKTQDPIEVVQVRLYDRMETCAILAQRLHSLLPEGTGLQLEWVGDTLNGKVYCWEQESWVGFKEGDYLRVDLGAGDVYPISAEYFEANFDPVDGDEDTEPTVDRIERELEWLRNDLENRLDAIEAKLDA